MTYCKDYCEEKGISTSKLTEAQRTLYYIAENMRLAESIAEEGYRHFQMAIKALEQDWIPVSERLPDDRRVVEVTAYWHETYQVMQGSYFGSSYFYSDGEWWCVPFNNTGEHMQRLDVIAWKELSKPYKGVSE